MPRSVAAPPAAESEAAHEGLRRSASPDKRKKPRREAPSAAPTSTSSATVFGLVVQIIDRRRELHLTQQRLAAAAGFGAERRQPHRAGRREPNGAQARATRAGVRSAVHSPRPAGRPEGRPPLRAARRGSRPQGGSVRGPPPTPVPPELVEFASSCGPGAPRTSTASVNREVHIWARAAVSARICP